jgi:myosin heavy subunit
MKLNPKEYSSKKASKYVHSRLDNFQPHLYSQLQNAHRELLRTSNNQTILFVGIINFKFEGTTNSGKSFSVNESLKYFAETKGDKILDKVNSVINILNSFGAAITNQNYVATRYVKT